VKRINTMLVFLCLLIAPVSFSQDCKTQAANKASTLERGADAIATGTGKMNSTEMAKMKPHLAKAENWTKKMLTNFTGAKLLYYNNFFPEYLPDAENTDNMFVAAGIKGHYNSKMMFFAYYCYDNSNTVHTEAESGSTVTVNFNNVFAFGFTDDAGIYKVNGRSAFKIIKKNRTEGRIDFYELRTQHNATVKMFTANDYIILRNSDKPVFISVTRKEYLQQMLKDADNAGTSDAKLLNETYTRNVKLFEAEMKVYKEMDKSYTPEKEAKRRKWFEEDQEKLKRTISKASPDAEAAKAAILQYLKKSAEWLNRTVKAFYPYSTYSDVNVIDYLQNLDRSYSNGEEETGQEIVTINPEYFNKTLSPDVPQVIMVHLRNGTYAHMEKVAALVKKRRALAELEAILMPRF